MKSPTAFPRKGPDRVTEELLIVLSQGGTFEFKALFLVLIANLKAKNAAGGGVEMLRLRAYEKLHNLVGLGVVSKNAKEYTGVPRALKAYLEAAAARVAHVHPAVEAARVPPHS